MTQRELQSMSMLALAHVGDGVFELMTRSKLCQQGHTEVQQLHRLTVARVSRCCRCWTRRSRRFTAGGATPM